MALKKPELGAQNTEPETTAIATTGDRTLAAATAMGYDLAELAADSGAGLENVGIKQMAIPSLYILQQLSPEVTQGDEKFVEGARPGDFYNTLTKAVYKGAEGILVVFAHFEPCWIEWKPRNAGGGFVAKYPTEEAALAVADAGNALMETFQHFVLVKDPEEGWEPVLFSCNSTKLTPSRRLNSTFNRTRVKLPDGRVITPATFFHVVRLTTGLKKNKAGQPYYNYDFAMVGPTDPEVYREAKAFKKSIQDGTVEIQDANAAALGDKPNF